MKTRAIFLVLAFVSLSITGQDKRLKNLDKELNNILEATQAAGFAVAVVDSVNILYSKGFGFRDYEHNTPVDTKTLFAIGSTTKAFTSGLLGLLRADNKLSFDDNPRAYIPELEFYNDAMNQQIIIKDLMRHSTGLPRHDGSWYLFPSHSKDSLISRMTYQEPFTGVRQQWAYNNFGFLVQGVITEKLTGKSWEENLNTHFFKPLGMRDTNASIAEMKASPNAALGYQLKDDVITKMDYYDIAGMSPAGSINSSVTDMSKWLMTWINKGQFQGQEILPESYITEAINSQMVVGPAAPDDEFPDIHFANYGYGWFLQSYKGHYRVEHGGNIDGFSASVAFFPSDGIGIIVLANQHASAVPNLVRNTIADRMIGAERTDWIGRYKMQLEKNKKAETEVATNKESSHVKNTNPSHRNYDYTGHYTNNGYGDFEITSKNDSLFTTINKDRIYLQHYHYDTFAMLEVVKGLVDTTELDNSIKLSFHTSTAGDISEARIQIEPMVEPIRFKRTPSALALDSNALDIYTGSYEIAGTTVKVYIKNDVLYLFVKGQPEYPQIPTAKHKFSFKTLEGFKIEFLESDDGTINAVKMIQPNGTFVAKRK